MKPTLLLLLTGLLVSSCASLMNQRTKVVTIITSEPTKLIVKKDTLSSLSIKRYVAVERSRDPLHIIAFTTDNSKSISVHPRNSFAWWLNLYPSTMWTGFIIDKNNPKRYTYPSIIYLDMNQAGTQYNTFQPVGKAYSGYSSVLKFSPLKVVSFINPGIELALEQKTSNSLSTQFTGAYLLPMSVMDLNTGFKPNIRGFQLGVEERYYYRKSAPAGPYLGLEFSYLNTRYKDIDFFGEAHPYADTTGIYTNYADTFGIKKQTYTLNFKIGYQYVKKRLSIDLYTGLGARYKDVVHFDRIKPEDEMEVPRHPNIYHIANMKGKYWTVNFPLNIRIGWTF
ncbi:MAG TPA: hypothetical protein VFG54_07460 [Prolixibacteraceae bacterium]|nr:hypothetical protein [Prolixibacteraceae bacterium]